MPEIKEREVSGVPREAPISEPESETREEASDSVPEVESVVEKIERRKSATQQKGDTQDDLGVVVQPQSDQPAVTLPITQDDVDEGEKAPIDSSFRWLVEWVKKQIKMFKGNVTYKEPKSEE